jgi:IS1 family transposase
MAIRLLMEGNSVRATGRLLGVGKKTILFLVRSIGEACEMFLRNTVVAVLCESVQCDEVWSFVHCKEKTRRRLGYGEEVGDCYTWTAIEPTSKLLLAFAVGKRDQSTGELFARRLRRATSGKFQIDTDGLSIYPNAFADAFGYDQDHAQVVKVFGTATEGEGRYSPAQLLETTVQVGLGNPDLEAACTSHIERSNKTLRMQIRRFTRLTDGHSKLWRNHEAAIALFFAYYNFCRVHSTIKTTPAANAGLTDHVWSVQELIERAMPQDIAARAS